MSTSIIFSYPIVFAASDRQNDDICSNFNDDVTAQSISLS